jgi:hypothetical protein
LELVQHFLKPHPDTPCGADITISVLVTRSGDRLSLRYRVEGDTDRLRYPPPAASERADGLWQTTCFEAFIGSATDTSYLELNFSPSTQWASYCLDDYRAGMREAEIIPRIEVASGERRYDLDAALDFPGSGSRHLGLTAVIEELDGRKSYWALAHPPGKPDFHQWTCFVLQLPAAV